MPIAPWESLPRRRYLAGPTPLEHWARLSGLLGVDLWAKRDDVMPLGGGGNKVRKLEYLVADALATGADTLITTGAVQSNHCRLTAAAAAREGLGCRLVLEERVPGPLDIGNPLLDALFGAEALVVPAGTDCDAEMAALAGTGSYVIAGGGSTPIGAAGYAAMVPELPAGFDHIVVASGSAGTQAGILVGLAALGRDVPVTGVSVGRPSPAQAELVRGLAEQTAALLSVDAFGPVVVDDRWTGPGYARATDSMAAAVRLVASTEGVLLDPVYTGKAMAGLIGMAGEGSIGRRVCFVHTGGSPVLPVYAADLDPQLPR